ncbi:MAG: UDP-N-acetylmuramoyl-tripeptide--D-alanyl-D-alanine ligase, partial [Lachnospiraceae bacterium]|nr:UDP-N-acetylmuramoyl-tripeptide--D-alanyl-D-alanine ligase [Lachnospiraceae bacterium]
YAAGLAAIVLGVRYTLHMFQQGSYQYRSYWRYMKTHLTAVLLPFTGVIPLLAFSVLYGQQMNRARISSLPPMVVSQELSGRMTPGYAAVLVLELFYLLLLLLLYRPRTAKKKLVYTARVKRLIGTTAVLYALAVLAVYLLTGLLWWPLFVLLGLGAMLSPYVVLLANLLNRPMEKGINRHYIRDARRMLKACPDLKIIGITGSYGKTSVKYYLHTLLSAQYDVLMTPESFNTPMGVVRTIRGSLKATHEIFLCEMGARHVGDIKEICDIVDPQIGVITSLGYQHLETFKSLDNIVGTKKELFDALPAGGPRFVNGDNEYVKQYRVDQGAITYGLKEGNAYRACDLEYSEKGTRFTVQAPDGSREEFTTGLLGEHNVINITGAIAVSHELGIPLDKLKIPVRRLEGAPHRLQPIAKGNIIIIDDAYNSNPNGAHMALKTLGMFKGVRVLVTPGMVELGEQEDHYNYEFGKEAAQYCDYIVPVGRRQTESIQRGVLDTDFDREHFYVAEDLQDAMNYVYGILTNQKLIVLLENDLPDNYL